MRLSPRLFILVAIVLASAESVRAADEDIVTKLPAKCEECQIAGGGRYLVMRLKATRGLTVYDSTTQKLSTLELAEDDIVFAAGGDRALVYLKEENELQTWNLTTGKMVKAKGFVDKPNIQNLVMGNSRGDLALVRMGRTPGGGLAQDRFIDTNEVRLKPLKYQFIGGGGGRGWEVSQLRANGDLTRIADWATTPTPNNVAMLTRTEGGYQYVLSYGLPAGMIPGDDGRFYTAMGNTLEMDPNYNPTVGGPAFKMSATIKGKTLVPAIGGQFVLAVSREGGLTLYQAKGMEALAPMGEFPGWEPAKIEQPGFGGFTGPDGRTFPPADLGPGAIGQGKELLTLDRRICFAPGLDHILFLPHANDKIVQRKFDLKTTLDATGEDYLMLVSVPPLRAKGGVVWEYQLKTVAKSGPLKYELPKAPEGMTVSAEGKLTWTPPKGVIGRAPVEVKGIDTKGKVVRQVFEVSFE
ncbi:MAG: hypothetical protein L0241_24505 [Planctomycetia bacterium]|nr:hypothetical protein [Planctomycetia bacterium]